MLLCVTNGIPPRVDPCLEVPPSVVSSVGRDTLDDQPTTIVRKYWSIVICAIGLRLILPLLLVTLGAYFISSGVYKVSQKATVTEGLASATGGVSLITASLAAFKVVNPRINKLQRCLNDVEFELYKFDHDVSQHFRRRG